MVHQEKRSSAGQLLRDLFESKKQERPPPKQTISPQLKSSSNAHSKVSEQTDTTMPQIPWGVEEETIIG